MENTFKQSTANSIVSRALSAIGIVVFATVIGALASVFLVLSIKSKLTIDNIIQMLPTLLLTSFISGLVTGWYLNKLTLSFSLRLIILHYVSGLAGFLLSIYGAMYFIFLTFLLVIELPVLLSLFLYGTFLVFFKLPKIKNTIVATLISFLIGIPVGYLIFANIARNDGLAFGVGILVNGYMMFSILASSAYIIRKV